MESEKKTQTQSLVSAAPATARLETNPLMMPVEHWSRMKEICEIAVRSGLLPKSVDTPQKAFVIALKGHELGFSPMYALERISVINGKPCIDGQGLLSLIYSCHGASVDLATPLDRQNQECEVVMCRPGQRPQRFRFTLEDAKKAELLGKDNWRKFQRMMLRWRVIAEGARIVFPDVIGGLYLAEEMGAQVNEDGQAIEGEFKPVPVMPAVELPAAPAPTPPITSDRGAETAALPEPQTKPLPNHVKWLFAKAAEMGISDLGLKQICLEMFPDVRSRKDLSKQQCQQMVQHWEKTRRM